MPAGYLNVSGFNKVQISFHNKKQVLYGRGNPYLLKKFPIICY